MRLKVSGGKNQTCQKTWRRCFVKKRGGGTVKLGFKKDDVVAERLTEDVQDKALTLTKNNGIWFNRLRAMLRSLSGSI